MTSSYKATGASSVRDHAESTPLRPVTAWALDELALPSQSTDPIGTAPDGSTAGARSVLSASERAQLIDQGYRRGFAEGEARAAATLDPRVGQSMALVEGAARELEAIGSLAPAILEENIAALAVIVARQVVAHEVNIDKGIVSDLVRRALTEFPIDQSVRIRVNPLDLSLISVAGAASGAVPITGTRDAS